MFFHLEHIFKTGSLHPATSGSRQNSSKSLSFWKFDFSTLRSFPRFSFNFKLKFEMFISTPFHVFLGAPFYLSPCSTIYLLPELPNPTRLCYLRTLLSPAGAAQPNTILMLPPPPHHKWPPTEFNHCQGHNFTNKFDGQYK